MLPEGDAAERGGVEGDEMRHLEISGARVRLLVAHREAEAEEAEQQQHGRSPHWWLPRLTLLFFFFFFFSLSLLPLRATARPPPPVSFLDLAPQRWIRSSDKIGAWKREGNGQGMGASRCWGQFGRSEDAAAGGAPPMEILKSSTAAVPACTYIPSSRSVLASTCLCV